MLLSIHPEVYSLECLPWNVASSIVAINTTTTIITIIFYVTVIIALENSKFSKPFINFYTKLCEELHIFGKIILYFN